MTRENWLDIILVSLLVVVIAGILAQPLLPFDVDGDKLVQSVVTAVFSLAAAFAGATFAFKYNRRHEAEKRTTAQVEACNSALINLMLQSQLLANYRMQMMAPAENHPLRAFALQAGLPIVGDHLRVDAASLAFLIETSARNVVMALAIEDERFHAVIGSINHRSKIHLDEVQPKSEKTGLYVRDAVTRNALAEALGVRLCQTMERATDEIYETVDACIESHETHGRVAAEKLRAVFPGRRILQFVRISPLGEIPDAATLEEAS